MFYDFYLNPLFFAPRIPHINEKPPTLYAIMNSIANFGKEDKTKIRNLAKVSRETIFDFDYPLSSTMNREDFEIQILNHFMYYRIGFQTITAFKVQLENKLNEIMPMYNKLFDVFKDWNIFDDGEKTTHTGNDTRTITRNQTTNLENNTTNNTETEVKNSDLPQSKLQNLRDEQYVNNFNITNAKGNDNSNSNGETNENSTDTNEYNEQYMKSNPDRIGIYKEFLENTKSIMNMIYKDLSVLFYCFE